MNQRQRFIETMTFGTPDRVPNHELGLWGQTVDRWLEEGMPEEVVGASWFDGVEQYGMDRREFLNVNLHMMPPFDLEVLEETDRHIVLRDGQGIVRKAMKEGTVRGMRPSMDQYLRFAVETPEDFADLKKRYVASDPARYPDRWDERLKGWAQRDHVLCLCVNCAMGLYSNMRVWMGTENLSMAFYDQPKLVHEMLDFITDFTIEALTRALEEVDIDYFNYFEDFAYKTGPLFSPAAFREFFMPRYKRINEFLRSHGCDIITLDSDGNTEVLMPLFIECGITGHWPLERAAEMDPIRLRKEYGKDLVFFGGIDKRELTKDKAAVEREVMGMVPWMIEQGGFIPHLDHTFPPDIPYDNFLYYLELKEKCLDG